MIFVTDLLSSLKSPDSRYAYELCVCAGRDWLSSLTPFDLEDVDLCEGETTPYLLCDAFDLDFFSLFDRALVRDMNVYTRPSLLTQIVRRNRQTTGPLHAA